MQSLFIFGRQPKISLAEIESLFDVTKVTPITETAAILDIDPYDVPFDRLGGSIKLAKIINKLPTTNWLEIEKFLATSQSTTSQSLPKGKLTIGISAYNFSLSASEIQKTAIQIKKSLIKQAGRSVRVVPNKQCFMNSAQVIHNRLTSTNGCELIIIKDHNQTIIAQTIKVQNIKKYAMRDQNRPFRDARVGMLPPKLAQIIINLSTAYDQTLDKKEQHLNSKQTILDPFCGTGVICQEALLMGYSVIGSDLDNKMVTYTKNNLDWLKQQPQFNVLKDLTVTTLTGDATSLKWPNNISSVATEMFLGKPLTRQISPKELQPTIDYCNDILKKFLLNLHPQIRSGARLCIATPAWHIKDNSFHHLPLIDSIKQLGYNRVSFKYEASNDFIYHRTNQVVGRELLIITKT